MDSLFINNILVIEANPDYYDYCHQLVLKKNTSNFELSDGGGQRMDLVTGGRYEINDNTLKLFFEYVEDIYTYKKTPINETNIITFQITKEDKTHFDGYCMRMSNYTITFNKSPFACNNNEYNEKHYSLIFYTQLENIECNTLLERFKRDRKDFFNNDKFDDENYPVNNYIKNIKEKFDKKNVSNDILTHIFEFGNKLFNCRDTPLDFITWLCNDNDGDDNNGDNNDNKDVIFCQRDMKMIITVGINTIKTFYYGYQKDEDKSRHKTYEYPADYELIKQKILGYEKYKELPNYDLLYDNLQKYRIEIINLVN